MASGQQFVNVRNSVAQRAAVALNEDFRSGLEDWQPAAIFPPAGHSTKTVL